MKTLILTSALLVAVLGTATAQRLTARTYYEKTKINMKEGVALGLNFQSDAEVGAFYQSLAKNGSANESNKPLFYEKVFYGIYGAYPVLNRRVVDVKYQLRTGISNGENFIITSSILGDVTIMNRVKVGAGLGTRNFQPTAQTSITIVL